MVAIEPLSYIDSNEKFRFRLKHVQAKCFSDDFNTILKCE